jgi:hypothetical protein
VGGGGGGGGGYGQVFELEDTIGLGAAVGVEGLARAVGSEEGSAVQGDAEEDFVTRYAVLEEVAYGCFAGGLGIVVALFGLGGASELGVVAGFGDAGEGADEVVGHEVD